MDQVSACFIGYFYCLFDSGKSADKMDGAI